MTIPWTESDLAARGYGPDGRRLVQPIPASPASPFAGRDGATGGLTSAVGDNARAAAAAVNAGPGSIEDRAGNEREAPSRNKFGAVRTVAPASWGGERLADSKAGAELSRTLETRKQVGSIIDWWEEVSLPLGVDERGKVIRYRADAMLLLGYVDAPDGGEPAMVVRFLDRKRGSMDTRTSAAKRAALRNRGLNVEVVK